MSEYIIATASTCDIDAEWLTEHNVPFISYSFIIDGVPYEDDCTTATKELVYKSMREGKELNTSAISVCAYAKFFESLLQTGKDILYVDMSRAISSSIQNCETAIEMMKNKYPDRRILFLDSFSITGGLKLILKQLVLRHENGMSLDDVYAWGDEHKLEYIHRFMVNDLVWLKKGGRLSNATAFVGTLLSLKPIIYVDCEGKLIGVQNVRGRKKCLRELVNAMQEDMAEYSHLEEITVMSSDDREDCEKEVQLIRDTYPQLKDANITITDLGPTICAHVGPDFMGIVYHGKKRVR